MQGVMDDSDMLNVLSGLCNDEENGCLLSSLQDYDQSYQVGVCWPAEQLGSSSLDHTNYNDNMIPSAESSAPVVQSVSGGSCSQVSFNDTTATVATKKRKCTGTPMTESQLIDEATDENLRQMNIDPDSKEGKKQRRRIRNRMSAQMHRERKRAYIETLEGEVRQRDAMISQLHGQLQRVLKENEMLRYQMGLTLSAAENVQPPRGNVEEQTGGVAPISADASVLAAQGLCANVLDLPLPGVRRLRAGTAVTSNEGSGSDSECSLPDTSALWRSEESENDGRESSDSPMGMTSPSPTLSSSSASSNQSNTYSRSPTFSLFSLVLMLGMSFFSGSFFSTLPPSPIPAPLSLPPSPLSATLSDAPVGGRVLLSLATGQDDEDNDTDAWSTLSSESRVYYPSKNTKRIPVTNEAQSSAPVVWKHQTHITSIYPSIQVAPKLRNSTTMSTESGRRYLRVGNETSLESSSVPSGHDRSTKDLALYYDNTWPAPAAATSKVLITQGRVVLDPSLVGPKVLEPSSSPESSPSDIGKAIIPSSWAPRSQQTGYDDSSHTYRRTDSSQLLTMLVPATAVQWGGLSWSEDGSNKAVMEHLLRNLNLTDTRNENGEYSTQDMETAPVDISSLWVEIGCNVLKARIVQNVSVYDGRHL
mmetsp:Transcript_23907/g.35088  ORF Transcript_23907/g.35088 Transcript_23907/m.35088 type:complete len:646 (+) Transcript_23907:121-2058(+)|eukprot:CAMPEP_0185030792 /NCGR_PEP_ID=MMETSP1103-20130426/17856_1 /TAXON_ID=36769 /ORGANISM="Paraphysomonas bandaiensis, Strain Caron Lab Isolate" /LENGTH=645 /DNA_ID=CAMNT_0027566051 /DNA_START=43 /DNA_END=1980 /DNA_ORIENTATION=+